jgi:uncharacterized protein
MSFYFSFVLPNRSLIELDKGDVVMNQVVQRLSGYTSYWWEKLCRQAISGSEIEGYTFGLAQSWWGNVSKTERIEIDLIAGSTDGKALLVGECKWTESENTERLLFELEIKTEKLPFAQSKKIIPCLFLKNSPIDNSKQNIYLPNNIIMMLNRPANN